MIEDILTTASFRISGFTFDPPSGFSAWEEGEDEVDAFWTGLVGTDEI